MAAVMSALFYYSELWYICLFRVVKYSSVYIFSLDLNQMNETTGAKAPQV